MQKDSTTSHRLTVRQFLDAGLSQSDIARCLGLSRQRVSQLATGHEAHDTSRQRVRVTAWQGRRCGVCLEPLKDYHLHHIIPPESGGSDEAFNLLAVCSLCHTGIHRLRRRRQKKIHGETSSS